MSKQKPTPAAESFSSLPIAEQVRRALPHARRLLRDGIESDPTPDREFESVVVYELARDAQLTAQWKSSEEDVYVPLTIGFAAARAVGIALGLLLRPEAFEGGVR